MGKHLSVSVTDELFESLVEMKKGDEHVNDTVRRILAKATKRSKIRR